MSPCSSEETVLTGQPLCFLDSVKCDGKFEEHFVLRSLQDFPPRSGGKLQLTRRKSTTCICRKCSRSLSPKRRSDPGQQMFKHLISTKRKPERLLVPDLATEWFRKQKDFLSHMTSGERKALQDNEQDENISLSLACDSSRSKLQHRVQLLDYCQERRRCKLLLHSQRHRQRNGAAICRCEDPPNWPPRNLRQERKDQYDKIAELKQKCAQRKKEQQDVNLAKTKRNPVVICNSTIAGCMPDSVLDNPKKTRHSGGCSCDCAARTKTRLYSHHVCNCEERERVRRHRSCACIFQADGQPMGEECLEALRTEPSLPRLPRKYNLREVPHRRLDPCCFRRISPEFYTLLKRYEDNISKKYPVYGMAAHYWGKTPPRCPCEDPVEEVVQPCLGDQSLVTKESTDAERNDEECAQLERMEEEKERRREERRKLEEERMIKEEEERMRMRREEKERLNKCNACHSNDCFNDACEARPRSCDCEGRVIDESDRESVNHIVFSETLTRTVKSDTFVSTSKTFSNYSELAENKPRSGRLAQLRSGFSSQPQVYKPPSRKLVKQDSDRDSDYASYYARSEDRKRIRIPQTKRRSVLKNFMGVCKRAMNPGRFLLYNFSSRQRSYLQANPSAILSSREVEQDLYSDQAASQKALSDTCANYQDSPTFPDTTDLKRVIKHTPKVSRFAFLSSQLKSIPSRIYSGTTKKSSFRNADHQSLWRAKQGRYTANFPKGEKTFNNGGNEQRTADIDSQYKVDSVRTDGYGAKRQDKHTEHSSSMNNRYIDILIPEPIEHHPVAESAISVDEFLTNSGVVASDYRDDVPKSESVVTIINRVTDNSGVDGNQLDRTKTLNTKSGLSVSQTLIDVGIAGKQVTVKSEGHKPGVSASQAMFVAEAAAPTLSERRKPKKRQSMTPRVNYRRSYTPLSDFHQVMRQMGRKRTKQQVNVQNQYRVTFATQPIEAKGNQANISTTTPRRSMTLRAQIGRSTIYKSPPRLSESQRANRCKKKMKPVQNVYQEVQRTLSEPYSDEDADNLKREMTRINEELANFNRESSDSDRESTRIDSAPSHIVRDLAHIKGNKETKQHEEQTKIPKTLDPPISQGQMFEAFPNDAADMQRELPQLNKSSKRSESSFKAWRTYALLLREKHTKSTSIYSQFSTRVPRYFASNNMQRSGRPLKMSSIRMNRKSRQDEVLLEHPVSSTITSRNPWMDRYHSDQKELEDHQESGESVDLDSQRQLRSSTINNDTSLDTIQHQQERLGTVTYYANQPQFLNDIGKQAGGPSFIKKKSTSVLPMLFTHKPPINEKLIRQREYYTAKKVKLKPRTYMPQRVRKHIALLASRPPPFVMKSVQQEQAMIKQARRWPNESSPQHLFHTQLETLDRPLQIREIEHARRNPIASHKEERLDINCWRSCSGCDMQFQHKQRFPLNSERKKPLREFRGYATPCSSACCLKSVEHLKETSSSCNRAVYSSALMPDLQYEDEQEDVDKVEETESEERREPSLATADVDFVKRTFDRARALRLISHTPATLNSSFKPNLYRPKPYTPINTSPLRESCKYHCSGIPASAVEQPPPRHRQCQHFPDTKLEKPCRAQLSSILKSPSKNLRNYSDRRRVNFVGSPTSSTHFEYAQGEINGLMGIAGVRGCPNLSIPSGIQRPTLTQTLRSPEAKRVPNEAHSFTFLNQEPAQRAFRATAAHREIKPKAPSLFAVPATPTEDVNNRGKRSDDRDTFSYCRLPYNEAPNPEEVEDESHLPMTSHLLSKPEDFRPKRRLRNNKRPMPPPVSLVSDLDFQFHCAHSRTFMPDQVREEGLSCPATVVTSPMDQLQLEHNINLMRSARAAACHEASRPDHITTNTPEWMLSPATLTSGSSGTFDGVRSQGVSDESSARTKTVEYYPRRRCCLRRLPEEPVVIGPTHGALREQQVRQSCLPLLFYGRQHKSLHNDNFSHF